MGGGLTHPRLQHCSGALGGLTSSVSRRVPFLIRLFGAIATPKERLHMYGDEIRNPVVFMIPSTGSGSGVGGRGMHNG